MLKLLKLAPAAKANTSEEQGGAGSGQPDQQKGEIMADSQQKIDWTALRQTALKCLGAALDLVSFAERAKAGYDAAFAAMHLEVIRNACDTLVDAVHRMGRWHFDCLALASVGEGPRPDFHFGEVSCATAHETAFQLLHAADTKLTEQLRTALCETGLDAKVDVNNLDRPRLKTCGRR